MNKKAIYTSMVGKYDDFRDPEIKLDGWDYICFSDDLLQKNFSTWEIRSIPCKIKNKLRRSRYVKINPHLVLKNYEFSLWIDANISIYNAQIKNRLEKLINDKVLIAIPKHPLRDCIYDEANVCIEDGRDYKSKINKQINFLKSEGFPENYGLFENNVIFRKHNHPAITDISKAWWKIYLQFSKRDQLSLAYVLWKKNVKFEILLEDGKTARNHEAFKYVKHTPSFSTKLLRTIILRVNKLS